jgi:hypothetical protein
MAIAAQHEKREVLIGVIEEFDHSITDDRIALI